MATFRLDREPWIPVVGLDGVGRLVSLKEVFQEAEQIASLGGSPLEVAAIMRFLLAIAHCGMNPADLAEWHGLWVRPTLLSTKAVNYIRENSDAWDLYSDDHPFLQAAALKGESGMGLDPTILDRSKFGCDSHLEHSGYFDSMPVASHAATRLLLAMNLFCSGGTGTPNPLIPKKDSNLDKYSSNSLAAKACVAFVEADTLARSIIANMLAGEKVGMPGWRRPVAKTRDKVPATGVADLFSRPTRTCLLYPSADSAYAEKGFLTSGEVFADGDEELDPLTPLVLKSNGLERFRLEPGVALWRAANVFLALDGHGLKVVGQLHRLARDYNLGDVPLRLRLIGIHGLRGKVNHSHWRDEVLPFGLSVLEDSERLAFLEQSVTHAENHAVKLQNRLKLFARHYLQELGEGRETGSSTGSNSKQREKDVARLANELSPHLNDYWSEIAPIGERIACDDFDEGAWVDAIKTASERAFRKAVDRLPPDARRFRAEYFRAPDDNKKGAAK